MAAENKNKTAAALHPLFARNSEESHRQTANSNQFIWHMPKNTVSTIPHTENVSVHFFFECFYLSDRRCRYVEFAATMEI